LERFGNGYGLCAAVDSRYPEVAYDGFINLTADLTVARDTLQCLAWHWRESARVICNGPHNEGAFQSGGFWTVGRETGFFRLIVVNAGVRDPGVFLQWVQHTDGGSRDRVRQTIAMPVMPRLLGIEHAELHVDTAGTSCVYVRSRGRPPSFFSLGPTQRRVALELGSPGVLRELRACGGGHT
jgi:hypothetical protein